MRKFTDTEIDLCKKIAEKERRKITEGDWLLKDGEIGLVQNIKIDSVFNEWLITLLINSEEILPSGCIKQDDIDIIPLWQEHDCLEWLMERGFYIERLGQDDECLWSLEIHEFDDMGIVKGTKGIYGGKSKLEPCLRAVLAVMEED